MNTFSRHELRLMKSMLVKHRVSEGGCRERLSCQKAGRTGKKLRNLGRKRVQGFGSEDGQPQAWLKSSWVVRN